MRNQDQGFALPNVLLFVMIMMALTGALAATSRSSLRQVRTTADLVGTYLASEAALSMQLSHMSLYGPLWNELPPLSAKPHGYVEFDPANFASSGGIPRCSGSGCHRNMIPMGGGLLKNLGPLEGDGERVETNYLITSQLDPSSPPTPDVILAQGVSGWSQVERLGQRTLSSKSIGGNLSNNIAEGGNAAIFRFRVTGESFKELRGTSISTVVSIVEIPAS